MAAATFAPLELSEPARVAPLLIDTEFGLVAGIWTRDVGWALELAKGIRAGQVFINNYGVGGGVELPFGGYKKSGIGREKGLAALLEYTQLKNVCVRTDTA
jgi:aldehyde dehydrogenase (NAD+)